MKLLSDVSEDGSICAVINETSLKVYNVIQKCLVFSLKKSEFLLVKPKVLKISPCKRVVACLQEENSPHQFTVFFLESRSSEEIKPANEYFFESILFSRDGQYIAAFSNLSIFTNIYALEGGTVSLVATINGASHDHFSRPMAEFSYDNDHFLSVDICKQGNALKIYAVKAPWDCVKTIAVSPCSGMAWCQDSASVLVWSLRFSTLQLVTLDGRVENSLTPLVPVSTVALSACGRLAAIYYVNNKIEILDLLTWQLATTGKIIHCPVVYESSAKFRLKEPKRDSEPFTVCETVTTMSLELGYDESKENCRPTVAFSWDSKLLASHAPQYPAVLWVWDLTAELALHTVVLLKSGTKIRDIIWHNESALLAAGLSNDRLLLWNTTEVKILNTSENPWPLRPKSYFAAVGEV